MSDARNDKACTPVAAAGERRAYRAPRLTVLGDVRSLTMGGSPGTGASSNPFVTESPTG